MFASAVTGAFGSPLSKPGFMISRRAEQHQDLRRARHRCAVARSQPLAGTTGRPRWRVCTAHHRFGRASLASSDGSVEREEAPGTLLPEVDRSDRDVRPPPSTGSPAAQITPPVSARTPQVSRPVNVRRPEQPICSSGRYGRFAGLSVVGETGFEPATARPPAGCATRLRHSPWLSSGRRESNPP